ncbi:tetratricopeptide repeat protein [candidate division WOR-3 bacterium]|uniref:Tetratricopeptide repeat protein n=1 Tax=candidate division WOR-3 bacterium TaxID=2052148 RepID=A0A9D5QC52_UNCW3|nr:tetratricopeptide repeat protein [candidate division WOR-3 bacterium]MBD3363656.1 tetratricopeptide repeat protein [candidate division WOR-3 bacterium]
MPGKKPKGKKHKRGEGKIKGVSVLKKKSVLKDDTPQDEVAERLRRILNKGLRAYRHHNLGEAKRLFSEGKGGADDAGWERGADLFESALFIIEGRYERSIGLLESLVEDAGFSLLGYAYYFLGIGKKGVGDYEGAIDSLRFSLSDLEYDGIGESWEQMGIIYFEKSEFERAVRCFEEALADDNYDSPGFAYYTIGNANLEANNYEEALESYRKALSSPDFDTPGVAWDSMGLAYFKKGDFEKAINFYSKALATPNYETPGYAWFNMGVVYQRKELLEDALEYMIKARDWYRRHEPGRIERVEYFIRDIKQQKALRSKGLTKAAEEVKKISSLRATEPDDPVNRIMDILVENREKIPRYAARRGTGYRDILAILKGWSSFIPVEFYAEPCDFEHQLFQGGGYFLKVREKGIVIDPGVDFLVYFTREGFHIKEVDYVFVTRNHMEHSANLTGLADLYHQWRLYEPQRESDSSLDFYLNPATKREYEQKISKKLDTASIHRLAVRKTPYRLKDTARVDAFGTTYDPKGTARAVGFVMTAELENGEKRRIGYTSDTNYFRDLPRKLAKCDVILTHFSIAGPEGFEDTDSGEESLNYQGLRKLIEGTRAKLYVISKFWGARGDYRIEFIDKLLYDFSKKKRGVTIIPGDVGCMINLSDYGIRCSNCGAFVPYEDIEIQKPSGDFGKLAYVCRSCRNG